MDFCEEHELKHPVWDKINGCQRIPDGAIVTVGYNGSAFCKIQSLKHDAQNGYYVGQIKECPANNELGVEEGDFVSFKPKNVMGMPETTHIKSHVM